MRCLFGPIRNFYIKLSIQEVTGGEIRLILRLKYSTRRSGMERME